MPLIRKIVAVLIIIAVIAFASASIGFNTAFKDAWAVGQYGAAVGGLAAPLVIALLAAYFVWPRQSRSSRP